MNVRWTVYRIIIGAGFLLITLAIGDIIRLKVATPPVSSDTSSQVQPSAEMNSFPGAPGLEKMFALPGKAADSAEASDSGDSRISRLYNLELKGTVAGRMAVVMDLDSRQEHIVALNQSLNDFTVDEITRNRLVISGEKGRDTLVLPAEPEPTGSQEIRSGSLRVLQRDALTKLLGNVDELAGEISLQPVRRAEGGTAGYRITALKPRGILAGMGLRKNDLLKTINGQQIQTPEDVYRVLESTVHENNLTVTIRRSNSDRQLQFQIR